MFVYPSCIIFYCVNIPLYLFARTWMDFWVTSCLGNLFPVIYCCKLCCCEFSGTYLFVHVSKSSLGVGLPGRRVNTFFTSNSKLFFKVVEPVNTPSSCCFTSVTTFGNVGFLNFTQLKCLLLWSEKALPWFLMRLNIFSYVYLPLILAFLYCSYFPPLLS